MQATERSAAFVRARANVGRRWRALLAAAVLGLAWTTPQVAAAQFGDLLRNGAAMIPAAKAAKAAATPAPAAGATPSSGASGAMGLQPGTPLPPLKRLGTDAVAVVEAASPNAPVREMDYVFVKQSIKLPPKGRLTLSYLSGCLTESIDGGVVTVALGGSTVSGGKRTERTTPGCRATRPVILASASEAGATVNRVTPFSNANWNERALRSTLPVFKWEQNLEVATVRVKDMDKPGEPVIWQGPAGERGFVNYPPKTAPLAAGAPYKAEALAAGGAVVASALFSIDPALDVADNLANRVVPLSAP